MFSLAVHGEGLKKDILVWVAEEKVNDSQSAVVSKHLRCFTYLADVSRGSFIF